MKGSKRRVRAVLNGERPDRIPLYELIRNDRVIEHFSGSWPTPENGEELVFRTFPRAVGPAAVWTTSMPRCANTTWR